MARRCDAVGVDTWNVSAPAGKAMKYARQELERRFLLAEPPSGEPVRTVVISDRYFTGTRLRLRRMDQVEPAGTRPVFKLTQKVKAPDGGPGLITNVYLSEQEFELLATLPGAVLTKTRYSYPPLGVDVFSGELDGLILAEAEFETPEESAAFTPPVTALAEVTLDVRFTGGELAKTSTDGLLTLLRSMDH